MLAAGAAALPLEAVGVAEEEEGVGEAPRRAAAPAAIPRAEAQAAQPRRSDEPHEVDCRTTLPRMARRIRNSNCDFESATCIK